jgi:leucine dehydrogenase
MPAMESRGHELVVVGADSDTGLRAVIAIHSTALGPALGGVRMYPYPSEEEALQDALRLSEGMSLKSAAAGLALGGGKAVIIGDPSRQKTPQLLREFGKLVDRLGGAYITAEDVGTTVDDMLSIAETTGWVSGLPRSAGGSGDPSPMTARGVVAAMRAVAKHLWGLADLTDRRIAIQGVGKVGAELARLLAEVGARVLVSDIDERAARQVAAERGGSWLEPDEIIGTECDILAPCALGGVLNDDTIPALGCEAIVGSANNQLAEDRHGLMLAERGILYAPDFVANAGGVINISVEFEVTGYEPDVAWARVDAIESQMLFVLEQGGVRGLTPTEAATEIALERIDRAHAATSARRPGRATARATL